MVSGGPPCPGFSLMGRSKIANLIETGEWEGSDSRHAFIDDPRNQLFREFVAYVAHFKPKYFLMENVKGMVSYKNQQRDPNHHCHQKGIRNTRLHCRGESADCWNTVFHKTGNE